eukprot:1273082-Pleurochrysis_carterae.AAC.2
MVRGDGTAQGAGRGERWRAAPGGERRERKARGDERWPAATDLVPTLLFSLHCFLAVDTCWYFVGAVAVIDGFDKAHGALNIKCSARYYLSCNPQVNHRKNHECGIIWYCFAHGGSLYLQELAVRFVRRSFQHCARSSLVSTWRSASRGGQHKAPGGERWDSARRRAARVA